MDNKNRPIIIFDGDCNFCSRSILWIIKHDKKDYFRFTSSQAEVAQKILGDDLNAGNITDKSIILFEDRKIYTRSTAVLRIARKLDGAIPLLYTFIIVPAFIRNFFYSIISRYRYAWFGKRDTCFVPDERIRNKFL